MRGLGLKLAFAIFVILLFSATRASAGTICPNGIGVNPFLHSPDSAATGCNEVVTINADGSSSFAIKDTEPYEESEDVLIGVVNNSSTALSSLALTGVGIFGFEGDGICTFTFVGSGYCSSAQMAGTDPGDYQGPTSTYSAIAVDASSGTVNFGPSVAGGGGSTYFSLEGVPTSLTVTAVNGGTTTGTGNGNGGGTVSTPEPSVFLMLGVGLLGLMGLATMRRQVRFSN